MNGWDPFGYIVGALMLGVLFWAFFHDFSENRRVDHLTNEERMEALGRVVAIARAWSRS